MNRRPLSRAILRLTLIYVCVAVAFTPSFAQGPAKHFSLKNDHGRWWLRQGEDERFWSLGVDCTEIGDPGKPGNPNYDGLGLFGSKERWASDTQAKYLAWGINTLGGWSDVAAFKHSMPYAEVLHLGSYDLAPWHDLFAPQFENAVQKAADNLIPPLRNDPMLVGYFTDNELGWWDDTIFTSYFAFPIESPGKQKLVSVLRDFYKNQFQSLTKDWKTSASSFKELGRTTKIFLKPGGTGIRAVHSFNFALTSRYYKVIHDTIRKRDPDHLILGDRYAQYYNLETVRAATPFVDVISSNGGADWVDGSYSHFFFDNLYRMTGHPTLVSEFYFSAKENQSGNQNTGDVFPKVETQVERAKAFGNCLTDLCARPYMVGAHWFQFHDEPPKGRGDGEDFNFGLVDIYGKEYPLMIGELKQFNPAKVHQLGFAKVTSGIPTAPKSPMEDFLLHWNRSRGYITSDSKEQWADLYLTYDARNLYVGLVPMEYSDANLFEDGKMPKVDLPRLVLQINKWHGQVQYGGSGAAILTPGIAEIRERPGLKHMLVLRIPVDTLGLSKWDPGTHITFKANLDSHGRGYQMTWQKTLTLN
jgi:hypothetical protein